MVGPAPARKSARKKRSPNASAPEAALADAPEAGHADTPKSALRATPDAAWPRRPALPVGSALRDHESLASLLARLAQSEARWAAVRPLLAAELAAAARPGPLDDEAWVILADHAAAAAKLRHSLPDIEQALADKGWHAPPVKVKVRPPRD